MSGSTKSSIDQENKHVPQFPNQMFYSTVHIMSCLSSFIPTIVSREKILDGWICTIMMWSRYCGLIKSREDQIVGDAFTLYQSELPDKPLPLSQ